MLIYNILWIVHLITVILLITVVLLQTGKGSEVGFAFGSGAAQTMFGSSGGKTFITRFTVILAVLFMTTSILLALFQARKIGSYTGVMDKVKTEQTAPEKSQPAVPSDKPVVPPVDK
ncbi:MAG TPA: preprotein translocase subunit SecG [Candidatus Goldiibacteriota bacterium]|nr:preprotein translocase subunit SecG [Candidatus Goldiibacteriota bacterium]